MKIEHRTLVRELRYAEPESNDAAIGYIEGYASVFNSRSEDLGGFVETIAPGAFDSVLKDDVRALYDHSTMIVLGRSSAGTLDLKVDEVGLHYRCALPDTSAARDLKVLLERGDIRESSFGFSVAEDGDQWERRSDGSIHRRITKVSRLYDVSPVAFPAYTDASVAMRRLEAFRKETDQPGEIVPEVTRKGVSADIERQVRYLVESYLREKRADIYASVFTDFSVWLNGDEAQPYLDSILASVDPQRSLLSDSEELRQALRELSDEFEIFRDDTAARIRGLALSRIRG